MSHRESPSPLPSPLCSRRKVTRKSSPSFNVTSKMTGFMPCAQARPLKTAEHMLGRGSSARSSTSAFVTCPNTFVHASVPQLASVSEHTRPGSTLSFAAGCRSSFNTCSVPIVQVSLFHDIRCTLKKTLRSSKQYEVPRKNWSRELKHRNDTSSTE